MTKIPAAERTGGCRRGATGTTFGRPSDRSSSAPALARSRPYGRCYLDPVTGTEYPSVTTILKLLAKPALETWKHKQIAATAILLGDLSAAVEEQGINEVLAHLVEAPDRIGQAAANRGTEVHHYAEAVARGTALPEVGEEAADYLASFHRFVAEWKLEWVDVEATVVNDEVGYAGTLDAWAFVRLGPDLALVDWKTCRYAYAEHAMQLAALAQAPEVLHFDGTRSAAPRVVSAYAVILGPSGRYRPHPIDISEEGRPWRCFRAAADLWHGLHEGSLVGLPVPPPVDAVTACLERAHTERKRRQ
jgi:hypothetical protein